MKILQITNISKKREAKQTIYYKLKIEHNLKILNISHVYHFWDDRGILQVNKL